MPNLQCQSSKLNSVYTYTAGVIDTVSQVWYDYWLLLTCNDYEQVAHTSVFVNNNDNKNNFWRNKSMFVVNMMNHNLFCGVFLFPLLAKTSLTTTTGDNNRFLSFIKMTEMTMKLNTHALQFNIPKITEDIHQYCIFRCSFSQYLSS